MNEQSERKRIPPHFNAAWFCTCTEEADELQRFVSELIRDHEPVSIAEVFTIQRVALTQWKALRAARLEAGLVQALSDARLRHENSLSDPADIPDFRPDPDSVECTELLGRAVRDDCSERRAYVSVAASTAVADKEFHRCLGRLDRVRDLRARGKYASGTTKPAQSEAAPAAAPAVFTAA
ncbi:MAG TPA: hypothetical protein VFA04_26530 [Bryobacteraceae bacterium]|nr:hypothetical protein [Bryobacteraceae bacterium]